MFTHVSLTFILIWFALISFALAIVWRVPLWVPVGILVLLQFLTLYPVK
jgi:hypothetical protein